MHWWLCFPTLWTEQSHPLAPEGLTPVQCPHSPLFFLKKFHFTVITSRSINAAYQIQLRFCLAQSRYLHHTLLVQFLTLTPTARQTTFCWNAGIVSHPTGSGQSQVTLSTTHPALTFYLFPSPASVISTISDNILLSKLLHGWLFLILNKFTS